MSRYALVLGLLLFTLPAHAQNTAGASNASFGLSSANNPAGRWLTASGTAVIQISPCGADLCGTIVGLALAPNAPTPVSWNGNSQCGLTIFRTAPVTDDAGQTVWVGNILDPRDGSQYDARIKLASPSQLELRGYIGLPIFGETQTWQPYAGAIGADCRLQNAEG